ncbi:MAG: ABC transporter permease [Roseimicrobium sp.]
MKYFPLIWSNLNQKRIRTTLTLLSILVAFLLFAFLCTIREALTAGVTMAGADRLVVRHKVSLIQTLPQSYEARITNIPGVNAVAHQTWFGGIYQDPKNFFPTMPVVPEKFFDMFPEFILNADQKQAWLKNRTGAIVGRVTADRFGWKVGDRVPLTSPIWGEPAGQPNWDFEIVGIYDGSKKSTDTSQFFFRYEYFEEARQQDKGQVGWFTVRIADPAQAADIAGTIDTEFANSPYETRAEPEGAFASSFVAQVGNIGTILTGVPSAVFFTILLVAANTMGQAVRERTTEIGTLKAIGYSNRLILFLILGESCLIAVLGGLAGLGIAWLLIASGNPVPGLLPVFYFPTRDLLIGAALALALGLVAGAFPSLQAMRLRISEAMRLNG